MKVTKVEITCKVCGKVDWIFDYRAAESTCSKCAADALTERLRNDPIAAAKLAQIARDLAGKTRRTR